MWTQRDNAVRSRCTQDARGYDEGRTFMAGKRQFGNVRQLPSGRWQAFYRYAEQRHKAHTTFETKMDAEGWLVDERRQIERDDWTPPEARRQAAQEAERARRANTFEAYARAWLTGRHDLRPTTLHHSPGEEPPTRIRAHADGRDHHKHGPCVVPVLR